MTGDGVLVIGLAAVFVAFVLLLSTVGAISAERAQVNRSMAALRAIDNVPDSMRKELDRPFDEIAQFDFVELG